ncbi:mechanosensitive ion channel family protein [Paraburkholderia aromaticivorans]|uniref:mechanosensitive ion channel family protein n=1 Tax=Paraburkholderia aromaticivorans TaxID=2026199 RepID=UPI0014560702|nr:mechanosensitive ion channel domain-containing protein [Paraburkholderia aromaticivorans]
MFDNALRIESGPDWHHFHVYTDSEFVAVLLVVALLVAILLASAICYYVTRSIMLLIVSRLARQERHKWLRAAERHKVFHRLAPLVPAAIVYAAGPLLSGITFPMIAALGHPLSVLAACYMVYTVLRAALAFLDSVSERYSHFPSASERPIKSFLQIATIVLYVIALIAVISVLLERSPAYFLTGLSAMTALLIIIFRETLLGFVASIQLAAYDMLRVGDWIEVPGFVADGTVIDIALNTIKVQNFDNSIVMVPSYVLLTNGVKNWRGMTESGGRRVKHSIHFDADTVRFPDEALLARLHSDIDPPLAAFAPDDAGRRTNLGLYRLYLSAHFRDHPAIRHDMPLVIRQVQSSQPVVALEIFLYIDETRWEPYENLQSDMLDHAYGLVPLFGLRCWQPEYPASRQP